MQSEMSPRCEREGERESMSTNNRTSKNNRKRFNDEQIKSLETAFETESRPELRLKQHLANNLGLQPRQVAIWFQNKRARSKFKHVERDYNILKANYNKLASQLESLKKQNQALQCQLQRLRKTAAEREEDHEDKSRTLQNLEKPNILLEINSPELGMALIDDFNGNVDYLEDEDIAVLNIAQLGDDSSFTWAGNRSSNGSNVLVANTSCSPQSWNF